MANPTYDKDITGLLVIDPYNDFISEGGKGVEATVRYAAELGYEVTVVKDATASYSDREMRTALEVNTLSSLCRKPATSLHDPRPGLAHQNSRRAWNAIIRGELSPPSPTPSRPVGGEVAYVKAPKPVWVDTLPGMPA